MHERIQTEERWPCTLRGCRDPGGATTVIGFSHHTANVRDLNHALEPAANQEYQHCLGVVWDGQPLNLTNLVESFGIDLVNGDRAFRWEIYSLQNELRITQLKPYGNNFQHSRSCSQINFD